MEYRAVKVSGAQVMARLGAARLLRLRYKRKAAFILILAALALTMQLLFPQHPALAAFYSNDIFRPFQRLRNALFGRIPFSIGDLLYLAGFLVTVAMIVRWIYLLARVRRLHHDLAHSALSAVITLAAVYVMFFIGWGGNYYKPALTGFWKLEPSPKVSADTAVVAYDRFLIDRLNALAPAYRGQPFSEVNTRAQRYYRTLAKHRGHLSGAGAKASLYGYFMQYLGIQGYYNPFTGEAQVNGALPRFMLPFVVCHEMAHQCGIAAEDDANLLSYAICTATPDSAFAYSGYFNLWLYTQSRVKGADTALAAALMTTLNPLSHAQLDTLRAIRRKYQSRFSEYSGELYDSYLRLHHQKDGINSYDNVTLSAWALELRRRKKGGVDIAIP